jgi:uncharacterized LabA/DUF88 family protein
MPDRVMVFIDGSNIYRAFKTAYGSGRYAVAKLGDALAAGRPLVQIHFYTASVTQEMGETLYAGQQRFFAHLKQEPTVQLWTGRMVKTNGVWHEKGVDVQLATHLVAKAHRDEYDIAVLVSGDSDLVPAVVEVRQMGRLVENALPTRRSYHLFSVCSKFTAIDQAMWNACQPG